MLENLMTKPARSRTEALTVWALRSALWILLALSATAAHAQTSPGFNHASTGFILDGIHARISCESCHKPGLPARGLPKDCNNCHIQGGVRASTFQSATHIPNFAGQSCQDCHTQISWTPAVMRHSTVMQGQCARCHNGVQASTKPATHMPTTASCDACHTTGAWAPTKAVVHDATTVGRCSTCHDGRIAMGKSPSHVPTNAQCDTCHTSTVTFKNAQYLHDPSTWGRCSQCHNGATAKGRPPTHIPTGTTQCDSCHTNQITFTAVVMNHTGMAGKCSTCHGGAYVSQNAQTKPVTHTATSAQCDSSGCHASTTTWAGVVYSHTDPTKTYTANCSSCHFPGGSGLSKPSTHIPTAQQCDTCHTNFVAFKPAFMQHTGTSGVCATCHNGTYAFANAQAKSTLHIPTSRSCDACHLNFIAFSPATMDHTGLNGQCSSCHSGAYLQANAQMKPVTHTPTSAQCDSSGCHASTTTWAGAAYSHTDPTKTYTGNCSSCHFAGGSGLSKPTNHVPTVLQCDTCHTNFFAFKPAFMNHNTGTIGQCNTCHNGSYTFARADRQGTTHIPDARQCDTCHTSTLIWTQRLFVHPANAPGTCSTCHSGQYLSENAQTKTATHVPTTAQCDSSGCHASLTTWSGVVYSHTAPGTVYVGNCSTCHVAGGAGLAKPSAPAHVPTTAQCDTCHTNYVAFRPAFMNHTGAAGKCNTCHIATYASFNANPLVTPPHIPDARQCDTCHTGTVNWTQRTMNHTGLNGKCSTCHGGSYVSENAQTVPASGHKGGYPPAQCDNSGCHTSTTTWAGVIYSHTVPGQVYTANCSSCHTPGGVGLSKPTPHVPTTAQCDTCHKNYTAFKPAQMNHTGLITCISCHDGTYVAQNALTKPATHVPTSAECNSSGCHTSTTTWTGVIYSHTDPTKTYINNCSSCHAPGNIGLPKPAVHIPTLIPQCDNCHKNYTAFKPAQMNHTGAGACSTCHGSTTYAAQNALTKPASHVPTTSECNSSGCHSSTDTWVGANYQHTDPSKTYTNNCSSCHFTGGSGLPKPSTHIPTIPPTQQCDVCHKNYALFKPAQMDHTGTATKCSTCHNATYASTNANPKGATHIPTSSECDFCHKGGYVNWTALPRMDHTGLTACATCHSGAYLTENAQKMSATHIPIGANQCSACHTGFIAFSPATMNHTAVVATACATCHGGAYVAANAQTKPATHMITTPPTLACNSSGCHSGYTTWALATVTHTASFANTCNSCHLPGSSPGPQGLTKPSNHIPAGALQCDQCHNMYPSLFKPIKKPMNHTAVAATPCASCHNATYAFSNANPQGTTHIPTALACSNCHKTGFVDWIVPLANMDHTGQTGKCATCHGGQYLSENAAAKSAAHLPENRQCDVCHNSFLVWTTGTYVHPATAPGTCKSCHDNAIYASQGFTAAGAVQKTSVNHIPYESSILSGSTLSCEACHTGGFVNWTSEKMNHNGSMGNGSGWCKNCHATGTNYLSTAQKKSLTHDSPGKTDCSVSGCHKPLGSKGTAYSKWN